MHFSLFSTLPEIGANPTTFTVIIAVLACILGAEIAGIGILISKMLRARKAKLESSHEDGDYSSGHYAVGMLLLLGTVPQSTYVALSVLVTATAVLAVVFVVLLIIFRACGYELLSNTAYEGATEAATATEQAESPTEVAAEEVVPLFEESEEQRQDAYTAISDATYEDPFAVLNDTPDADTDDADAVSAEAELEPEQSEPTPEMVVVTAVNEQSPTAEPAFADGTQPYKVVEKVVTETVKEIYKETPAGDARTGNDAVMEKLVDLLDFEIRSRRELELADAAKAQATRSDDERNTDAVPTFASSADPSDDDLDEDQDDEDDDTEDAAVDKDDIADDEENDTDGDHFTGNERIIGFDEVTGCYIVAHYRKSFEAKLIQARPNIKKYYSDIKNALLSYKGTKNRISWNADSFHNGREQIAKINVKTRILEIYFALDPASLDGTVYRGRDVGSKKKYADTPFQYKVRTPRKFKWAMELVQRVCEEHGLSPIDIEPINYEELYPFDTTENLVERKLIKEYIRQEKPASSFELDPDHVPEMPQEDETVIPANANFSWEFDNEAMVEQEPIEEPAPQPEPEPEPEMPPQAEAEPAVEVAPAAPAPEATVVRETVKVTEVRYTERYYADAEPSYEQVVTTTEPIETVTTVEETVEPAPDTDEQADIEEPYTEEAYAQNGEEADLEEAYDENGEAVVAEEAYTVEEYTEEASADEEELFFGDEESAAEDEDFEAEEEVYASDEEEYASEEEYAFEEEAYESDEEEEAVEIPESWKDKDDDALPFRPSFYASRNYDADEEAEEPAYEEDAEASEDAEEVWEDDADTDGGESTEEQYEDQYEEEQYEEEQLEEPSEVARPVMASVNPTVAVIDICALEPYFEEGDLINLESLKVRELILPSATTLKLYASREITKKFTVEANHFTLDAIQAISDADGDVVMVR